MKAHYAKNCDCKEKGRPTLRVLDEKSTKKTNSVDLEVGVLCNKCRKAWTEKTLK